MGAHSAVWQASPWNDVANSSVFLSTGYVDSSLMGSGQFDKAAILSHDLSGTEAYSPGFTISVEELKELAAAFDNSGVAMTNGFHVGGEKFVAIRADERSLYGKKGKEGIVVVKAKSCVMIAHHPETIQTTNAATVVENLVDYINKY
ncbi:profilin [Aspergillus nomiae NRRL 13137]|uniref:Profilin n=1 Tax=Aspergillus nomiae NRRL (strain ATCC 15546 / NRRL 13137 / CBS 260.88 / M93) TaxID=1509407 RepID=A0A0L1JA00_ASPN3|nr:profilin [Aspergillus nomiae NRRL 13137]KNG88621.1 profilin [Aspergillus nomiae NRRL 13137]